jgi:hypothetical protein
MVADAGRRVRVGSSFGAPPVGAEEHAVSRIAATAKGRTVRQREIIADAGLAARTSRPRLEQFGRHTHNQRTFYLPCQRPDSHHFSLHPATQGEILLRKKK